jgi:hypothetical protein
LSGVPLSPFTQYFVRKLLRRYLAQPQSLTPYLKVADPDRADLAKVLRSLCGSDQKFNVLLYELEALIDAYSKLESNQSRFSPTTVKAELNRLELQIQHLLGLRLGQLLPRRLPQLLPEIEGQGFQFCWGKRTQAGIVHHGQFYGLLQQWQHDAQLQAYQLAWTLAQRDVVCMITRSPQHYSVWINLKSPAASTLLHQGKTILPSLLRMHPAICRRQATIAHS